MLNVMPCVLPVLGIKLLGFAREAGAQRRHLAWHGLMYGAGVLVSFALLAAGLLALRAGGRSTRLGVPAPVPGSGRPAGLPHAADRPQPVRRVSPWVAG